MWKKLYKGFLDACCPFLKGVSFFLDISCRLLDDCCSEFGWFWMMSHTNQARKAFPIHLQTLLVKNNCGNGFHSLLVQLCAMEEAQLH